MGIASTSSSAAGAAGKAVSSGLDKTTIIVIIVIIVAIFIIALIVWVKSKQEQGESQIEAAGGDNWYPTPRFNPGLPRETAYNPMVARDPSYNHMVTPDSSFNPTVAQGPSYNPMVVQNTSYIPRTIRAPSRTNPRDDSYDMRRHQPRDTAKLLGGEDMVHEGLRIPSPVTPAGIPHDWSRISHERRGSRGSDELNMEGRMITSFVDGTSRH